jgi:hypothetical protein
MRYVMVLLALFVPPVLTPALAIAQGQQPGENMMMHGTMLEGTVTQIRFVSCESGPQSCQGIVQVTRSHQGVMSSGAMAMPKSTMTQSQMMMDPVTVIFVPGTTLMWENSELALTHLKVGDMITCEYITLGGMNIVAKVTMTGMGHR